MLLKKRGYPWGCCFYVNGCRPAGTLRLWSDLKGHADRGNIFTYRSPNRVIQKTESDLFQRYCTLLPFCGNSETAPNKTVPLVWWVSLQSSVWREAFIRALHHPHAVYQPLNLTLTISSVCVYIMCVFVLKWAWRVWTFPLRPRFHWPSRSYFLRSVYVEHLWQVSCK